MTKNQLKEIMEFLSAIDNRQLTAEKLQVWFDLIGYLDFEVARDAVILAVREPSINYLEPKHVIAFSQKIKERKKTEEAREKSINFEEEKPKNPMPKCVHNKGLLFCDTCCRNAAIQAGLIK
jgi:hypothetical protein